MPKKHRGKWYPRMGFGRVALLAGVEDGASSRCAVLVVDGTYVNLIVCSDSAGSESILMVYQSPASNRY
jgi:hypothetical protein